MMNSFHGASSLQGNAPRHFTAILAQLYGAMNWLDKINLITNVVEADQIACVMSKITVYR